MLRATLLRWQVRAAIPRPLHAFFRERLPKYLDFAEEVPPGKVVQYVEDPSSARLLELRLVLDDLDERIISMHRFCGFVQQGERVRVFVSARDGGSCGGPKTAKAAKGVIHSRGFVTAMNHAIRALRVAGFRAVVLPLGRSHELLETVRVAVLEEIAGLLPAEDVVGWHAPRGAGVLLFAHQEFEKKRRLIELPVLLAVGKYG